MNIDNNIVNFNLYYNARRLPLLQLIEIREMYEEYIDDYEDDPKQSQYATELRVVSNEIKRRKELQNADRQTRRV